MHLLRRYKTAGDMETADASERYDHSESSASDSAIDASSSYPPQHNQPVLVTEAPEDIETTECPCSKDAHTNDDKFPFPRI